MFFPKGRISRAGRSCASPRRCGTLTRRSDRVSPGALSLTESSRGDAAAAETAPVLRQDHGVGRIARIVFHADDAVHGRWILRQQLAQGRDILRSRVLHAANIVRVEQK